VSLPRGDIYKLVSSAPFDLTCHLNPKHQYFAENGFRSKDMGFFAKTNPTGKQFVVRTLFDRYFKFSDDIIQKIYPKDNRLESLILNETTIQASYDPQVVGSRRVECRIKVPNSNKFKGICTQTIHVGCKVFTS